MTEIRFGGRCEKHLCPKPCTKCAEAGDSSTITVPRATWDALREALETLIKRDKRNTCQHEETHRGGVIWEICEGCGMKWADDRGGKPKWKNPTEWDAAESALTAANAVSAEALITVESSLRFRLECEQQKSADLLDEVLELKGKLIKARQPQAQGEAWVWNPASTEWEKVRAFGHWQHGAIYAFGSTQPEPLAHPQATEPACKQLLQVPMGYKLVPVEPTQEMLDAVVTTLDDQLLGPDAEKQYREDWAAMLAAAPEAKQ